MDTNASRSAARRRWAAWSRWLSPTLFHAPVIVAFVAGKLGLGEAVLGTLLAGLIRIAIWTPAAVRRRHNSKTRFLLRETCLVLIGLSLGVWGYLGIVKGASAGDYSLLGLNYVGLEVLGEVDLSDLDEDSGEGLLILLAIAALALFCYSLYLLYGVLLASDPLTVALLVLAALVAETLAYLRHLRRSSHTDATTLDRYEVHMLRDLARLLFLKGWVGALLVYWFRGNAMGMGLAFLGWSWLYETAFEPLIVRALAKRHPHTPMGRVQNVDAIGKPVLRPAAAAEATGGTVQLSKRQRRLQRMAKAAQQARSGFGEPPFRNG